MQTPTQEQYLAALETVRAYELNQDILFQEKVDLVKVDLDEFFKGTEIKSYRIETKDWCGNKGVFIFPTEPFFDDDYSGGYDADLKKISEKHGINIEMDSGIYGK